MARQITMSADDFRKRMKLAFQSGYAFAQEDGIEASSDRCEEAWAEEWAVLLKEHATTR